MLVYVLILVVVVVVVVAENLLSLLIFIVKNIWEKGRRVYGVDIGFKMGA